MTLYPNGTAPHIRLLTKNELAHESSCWRIGDSVKLENGVCPECGWYDQPPQEKFYTRAAVMNSLLAVREAVARECELRALAATGPSTAVEIGEAGLAVDVEAILDRGDGT